jgi:hypothetical protein
LILTNHRTRCCPHLEPRQLVRLALRVDVEGERVYLLLVDLLGLGNIYPNPVRPYPLL